MNRYLPSAVAVMALASPMGLEARAEGRDPGASIPATTHEERLEVTELRFEESEPGIGPYGSRQLVSAGYLRMDDGRDEGDYVLYDRKKRQIHSVTHQDRSILLIPHRSIEIESSIPLVLDQSKSRDPQAPSVSGLPPEHIVLSVNGKECHHVIAVKGLLREVNLALREYLLTLAGEQAENLAKTPPEQQLPCMLAGMIFAPTRHLEYGFPILEWDYRGHRRTLVGYRESVQAEAKLFRLPEGYRVFSINEPQPE